MEEQHSRRRRALKVGTRHERAGGDLVTADRDERGAEGGASNIIWHWPSGGADERVLSSSRRDLPGIEWLDAARMCTRTLGAEAVRLSSSRSHDRRGDGERVAPQMTQMGLRPFDGTEWRPAEFDEGMDGSTIVEDIHQQTRRPAPAPSTAPRPRDTSDASHGRFTTAPSAIIAHSDSPSDSIDASQGA